ncbi:jg17164 [Pararge aegeria aegeria]|uniref:Jg17164 protein n=1 Tax=Pararge aegeria aegeria TaxID=348720 RepID=A0A8S4RP31_9NEOP|nr:jg17164 [Pararge aegeria aegeria]
MTNSANYVKRREEKKREEEKSVEERRSEVQCSVQCTSRHYFAEIYDMKLQLNLVFLLREKQENLYGVIYNFFNPYTPYQTDLQQCTLTLYARFAPKPGYLQEMTE